MKSHFKSPSAPHEAVEARAVKLVLAAPLQYGRYWRLEGVESTEVV
jgi:ribosome biogenesis protein Tsr3